MRGAIAALGLAGAAPVLAQAPALSPGTYSNEEQVYFEKEAGRVPPPVLVLIVGADGRARAVDAYGAAAPMPGVALAMKGGDIAATLSGGAVLEMRRARPVTCWASLKRAAPKADGSEDWSFTRGISIHDQGGRALVGTGEAGVTPVILRMRNVTWTGSARAANRPSLVLYIHTPDQPDKAVSYVWADPGAARIGVNLRWMQASCTVDGREKD